MWFMQPKQDFFSELSWDNPKDSTLMSWQVKARAYDTSMANRDLVFMALVSLGGGYFGFYIASIAKGSFLVAMLAGTVMFLIFISLSLSITHHTTIFVYRFTETFVEIHSWAPQEAAASAFLKWSAIILLPVVGLLTLMDPALVFAGIGPLGMGLMALKMGSQQTKQSHNEPNTYDWRETDKIYLYPGRDIIGLNIPWYSPDQDRVIPNGINEIFCKEGEREKVLSFFKARLSGVEIVEEKFYL